MTTHLSLFMILLLLGGCSTTPHSVTSSTLAVSPINTEVYVVSHGWHTGFVLPSSAITQHLPQLKARFNNSPYIEFGWGDKGFYQAEEITTGLTVRAIFWPTESVIHAVAVPQSPDKYFTHSNVETLCLQSQQYAQLIQFIADSFHKDRYGTIIPLKNGIYGNSQFYKGVGRYHLMNTCNKWTAKGLKSAEMKISTAFKLTAGSIMKYLSQKKEPLEYGPSRCPVTIKD